MRVGLGYDIHRFTAGRRLVLGGVEIPFEYGLEGHSDADCLTHALADAILGAMALPDIGHFFPDTDERYRGMNSLEILRHAVKAARERGYRVANVDLAVVAEKPKIAAFRDQMREKLAEAMGVSVDQVGLKATTNEKIGDLGRGAGIAAHAVALLLADG